MNKNQALVWITIIVAVLIYSLNSVVHSKERYLSEIDKLNQVIVNKDLKINELEKKGILLTFEALEVTNAEEYKKNGNISQKVITLQNDNINISRIIDRYGNLKIRNTRAISKYKKVLKTISTEEEERLFQIEQAKKDKKPEKKPEPILVDTNTTKIVSKVSPILEDSNTSPVPKE